MKSNFLFLFLLPQLLSAQLIWQLGKEDASSREFWTYSNGEFRTNKQIQNSSNYNREKNSFTYTLPSGKKQVDTPQMPAGVSGSGAGNYSVVKSQTIRWNEAAPGLRELEIRIILPYNAKNYAAHRLNPNENMDIDGQTWVPGEIRLELPGKRILREYLPYDLQQYLAKRKTPLLLKAVFPVKAGENSLTIQETSGSTYGRMCHFDYLKLSEVSQDSKLKEVAEFRNHKNFLNESLYEVDAPAMAGVEFFNLPPGKTKELEADFIDFFDHVTPQKFTVTADENGFAKTQLPVLPKKSGHYRIQIRDGKKLLGETRIAGIRSISPLTRQEIRENFIGLSGLSLGLYFDPNFEANSLIKNSAKYRNWRRIMQIKHERIHSMPWYFVESTPGEFRWKVWDELLLAEKADGVEVQLTLIGTPKYLMDKHFPQRKYRHISEHYFAPPPDMEPWGNFCREVARRYGSFIKEFEIWNEVSGQSLFWQNGNADQFVDLVKYANRAIKSEAPDAKIVAETLWPRQEEFTRQLFEKGIAQYVDIHADHYLTDDRVDANNRLLERYAPGAPWISNENKSERTSNPLGQVDEFSRKEAAAALIRNMLYANTHGVKRLYNFVLTGITWRMWGIVGPDGTPKYTLSSLKTLINHTAGARPYRYHRLSNHLELFIYQYFSPKRANDHHGEFMVVLSNTGRTSEKVTLPTLTENYWITDLMDNTTQHLAKERIASIEAGPYPLFITGVDVAALNKMSSVTITPEKVNLKPGETIRLDFKVGSDVKSAQFSAEKQTLKLAAAENGSMKFPTDKNQPDSLKTIKLSGVIDLGERSIPVNRFFNFYLENREPGKSLLPEINSKNWRGWGKITPDFATPGVIFAKVDAPDATGAIRARAMTPVIPEARYLLDFQASGSGILRVMLNGFNAEKKHQLTLHNLLSESLGDAFTNYLKEWVCPAGVTAITLDFYQYKTQGEFTIRNLNFIRCQENIPLNRQLFKTQTGETTEVIDSSMLPSSSQNQLKAAFSTELKDGKLLLNVKVQDQLHHAVAPTQHLWQGDSLQVDFDLSDGQRKVRTVQFGFALLAGKAVIYRYSILPAEDIVQSYQIGENPAGVTARIQHQNGTTTYQIAFSPEAIHPQWKFTPGEKLGFSLLINNNDGNGRLGYLQWASGIGRHQDSRLFGELQLKK